MDSKDMDWSDKFSTDITSIDRQHQELLFLSQTLLEILAHEGAPVANKQAAFQDLMDHALAHFTYEERVMLNIGFPHREHHIQEHDEIRREIAEMSAAVMKGEGVEDWKGLVSMVQVWVLRHIVSSDILLRKFIQHEDDDNDDA